MTFSPTGHPAQHRLRGDQLSGREDLMRLFLVGPGRGQQDRAFGVAVGVGHLDLHKEPVKLRLGEGIGALLLDRVLRGEHMEGGGKRARLARHGDAAFLHRLQQRRLRARAGAVDLVGHQKLAEDRAIDEPERAAAVRGGFQHFGAENVGGHEIGGELHPVRGQPHDGAERLDQPGLAKAGQADQKTVPAAQKRRERQIDNPVLPDEAPRDRGPRAGQFLFQRLETCQKFCIVGHGKNSCQTYIIT